MTDIDSCGYIQNCEYSYLKKDTLKSLDAFGEEICSMFLNSSLQIKNTVILKDTSFVMLNAVIRFEIICEPSEVLYYDEKNTHLPNPYFIYRSEEEEIIFDGFKNGCFDKK
jgi:hypothetical protein